MSYRADMIVYNAHDESILTVEIKTQLGSSREWSAAVRASIVERAGMPRTPYFLLALPDRFYLWTQAHQAAPDAEPAYVIDPSPLLDPYYEKSGLRPDGLSHEAFELIVSSCLSEVLWATALSQLPPRTQDWLRGSGLFDAIKGGHVASEVHV